MKGTTDQSTRLLLTVAHLMQGNAISNRWIRQTFGVKRPTATRDLRAFMRYLPMERFPKKHSSHTPIKLRLTAEAFR